MITLHVLRQNLLNKNTKVPRTCAHRKTQKSLNHVTELNRKLKIDNPHLTPPEVLAKGTEYNEDF